MQYDTHIVLCDFTSTVTCQDITRSFSKKGRIEDARKIVNDHRNKLPASCNNNICCRLAIGKVSPSQYVRVCNSYGAGFFYIPGTDTCLKIGGRVRFDITSNGQTKSAYRTSSVGAAYAATLVATPGAAAPVAGAFVNKNGIDQIGWYSRGYMSADARTQTAWGTVQTAFTIRIATQSGILQGNYINGSFATSNTANPVLDAAYIRFAGFTFGRGNSNFTAMPAYTFNNDYWAGYAVGIKQLSYTGTFGGGFSATIALEDRLDMASSVTGNALGRNPLSAGGQVTATNVGPSRTAAVVGNIRVDQSWGFAQISGSVVENVAVPATVNVNGANILVANGRGRRATEIGWAVAGTVRVNLPMIATGDHFHVTAGYTEGMLENIFAQGLNGAVSKNPHLMAGLLRADRAMTIYCVAGAATACDRIGSEQTKAWNVGGIFTHYWTPAVRQNFAASYVRVTPGSITRNTDWQQGGLGKAYAWSATTNLIWSPVSRFDIGLELTYARMHQRVATDPVNLAGVPSGVTVAAACPGGVAGCSPLAANFKVNPNAWNARLRVQRDF